MPVTIDNAAIREHGDRVRAHILELIEQTGPMPFDVFMHNALYAPGLGYYVAGLRRFGPHGDFVTAPEISSLFGQCLARQIAEVAQHLPDYEILEFGPGTGKLAADILVELHALDSLPKSYHLLEISPSLRRQQFDTIDTAIPDLLSRVVWQDAPPGGFRGVILANEVLDAIPLSRFRIGERGPLEMFVGSQSGELIWQALPCRTSGLAQGILELQARLEVPLPVHYESELAPWRDGFVRTLADTLQRGVAFLIDYGYPEAAYYHPDRNGGTLQCRFNHEIHHDPLQRVGLQDISAHVDFTAIAKAARRAGLGLAGFTTQGEFLLGLDMLQPLTKIPPGSMQYLALAQEVKTLTLAGEMGESVKVAAFSRGFEPPLKGFAGRDRRPWLA